MKDPNAERASKWLEEWRAFETRKPRNQRKPRKKSGSLSRFSRRFVGFALQIFRVPSFCALNSFYGGDFITPAGKELEVT